MLEPTSNFEANFKEIFGDEKKPIGEDTRPKDRWTLGISPSCVVIDVDCRANKLAIKNNDE